MTDATTNEDTQTTSGLVISRNAADGAEVTHFKITSITNGTLFQNDGTTPINNGDFITFAQGNAGLKFTPAADFTRQRHVRRPGIAEQRRRRPRRQRPSPRPSPSPPSPTRRRDRRDDRRGHADDVRPGHHAQRRRRTEVTHFKITAIANGTLFQNDGTTPINDGDFITFAQASAG